MATLRLKLSELRQFLIARLYSRRLLSRGRHKAVGNIVFPDSEMPQREDLDDYNIAITKMLECPQSFNEEVLRKEQQRGIAVKRALIKKKYFPDPVEPNLLTWNAKQQIRLLHKNDPDRWTAEALAEGFSVSVNAINKVLKSKWHPSSIERLIEHDNAVIETWKKLFGGKEGPKINVPALIAKKLKEKRVFRNFRKSSETEFADDFVERLEYETRNYNLMTKPGDFTNIVKDYCEWKEKQVNKNKKAEEEVIVDKTIEDKKQRQTFKELLQSFRNIGFNVKYSEKKRSSSVPAALSYNDDDADTSTQIEEMRKQNTDLAIRLEQKEKFILE